MQFRRGCGEGGRVHPVHEHLFCIGDVRAVSYTHLNPGQVISPDLFMDKIWGYDSEAEQNVVWVYISYLRKKITSIGSQVKIRAARGLGYSLEKDNA